MRTVYPMSPNQADLIGRLIPERVVSLALAEEIALLSAKQRAGGNVSFSEAKAVISALLESRRKAGATGGQAEAGFYVHENGDAIQVVLNRAKTHTYAKRWTGTSWDYAPGVGKTLAGLTPMTGEEAARRGLVSGRCIACAKVLGGETLSAQVSALIGYGERCAGKYGWSYPKGVAAQREFLIPEYGEAEGL